MKTDHSYYSSSSQENEFKSAKVERRSTDGGFLTILVEDRGDLDEVWSCPGCPGASPTEVEVDDVGDGAEVQV